MLRRAHAEKELDDATQRVLALVDAGGIEPPTCRLRVECSAS
jgi:hypothetical protein